MWYFTLAWFLVYLLIAIMSGHLIIKLAFFYLLFFFFVTWQVEIGITQCFLGSFKGETRKNTWNESLKLKGWLSSQLFRQQFPTHYAEIIHTLPLQEYMNPASGILNIAARLPREIQKPDLGPCLFISYGHTEQHVQSDPVVKLHYDSYDMVCPLVSPFFSF